MLFFIFVAMLVVGVILAYYDYENSGIALTILGSFGVLISVLVLAINFIGVDGYIARMNTRYDMLTYQYENDVYDNNNDLGKRELIVDIQEWNEDLSARRERQDDFWIGIYIPNIYDQFEYIQLGKE